MKNFSTSLCSTAIRVCFAIGFLYSFFLCVPAMGQHPDVHEESYHVPIFEWDCLRFLNVRANPGDTTAYHIHRNPICYITIHGSEVWLDDAGNDPRRVNLPDAWVGSDHYNNGDTLLHRFSVVGEDALFIIAVERMGPCESSYDKPVGDPFYSENGFSIYSVDWDTYLNERYDIKFPAIVPPQPIYRAGWAKYEPGYVLQPVEQGSDHTHMPGVEILWVVTPSNR